MASPSGSRHRPPCGKPCGGYTAWDTVDQEWFCLQCGWRPTPPPLREVKERVFGWQRSVARYTRIEPRLPGAR